MKRRILTIGVLVLAVVSALALRSTPASVGSCSCPKGKVCCFNCDGSFAYCGRSHAFCPECPAP
jgi:hypothetical protein